MCPQAEGRLGGEVDEVRGYHKGACKSLNSKTYGRIHQYAPKRRAGVGMKYSAQVIQAASGKVGLGWILREAPL